MQTHPEIFPPERRNDPRRRAEARVFDELRNSHLPGFVYYEWQRDRRSPQLDFPVWLPGVGRYGLQVKGGQYRLLNGNWYLMASDGSTKKDCPVRKTWDATMSLHDDIVKILGRGTFFIAVLVFPDMEPDQAIAATMPGGATSTSYGAWTASLTSCRKSPLKGRCTTLPARRTSSGRWPPLPMIRSSMNPRRTGPCPGTRSRGCPAPRRDLPWRSPPGTSPSSTWTPSTSTRFPVGLRALMHRGTRWTRQENRSRV